MQLQLTLVKRENELGSIVSNAFQVVLVFIWHFKLIFIHILGTYLSHFFTQNVFVECKGCDIWLRAYLKFHAVRSYPVFHVAKVNFS